MKREIDILDRRRRNWLVELEQYEQAIHNITNLLNFNNKQQHLLQVKYKNKLEEDKKRNTDNWNDHFDKLKATYKKEQESNNIDNLLKYVDKQSQNENAAANNNCTQKITRANFTDHATDFHECISLSKVPLNNDKISVLKLGLSLRRHHHKICLTLNMIYIIFHENLD